MFIMMQRQDQKQYKSKLKKYKYNYKRKVISIPLFEEDGITYYHCIIIYNNVDINSLLIYDRLRFYSIYIIGFPICYSFTDTPCEEAVKSRMVMLMTRNPRLSMIDIEKITGHGRVAINRHYMLLKRAITKK